MISVYLLLDLLYCGLNLKEYLKIFRPINLLIVYYDNRARSRSQGNIGINPLHRVSDMATPNETWCNVPNKSISIFVSERRPRCDRISSQTRSYLVPDAFVSPPRCVRLSSQMRSSLLPDALKSIGLELRRIMRPSSTVEARKR